jgi:hypothetical protein
VFEKAVPRFARLRRPDLLFGRTCRAAVSGFATLHPFVALDPYKLPSHRVAAGECSGRQFIILQPSKGSFEVPLRAYPGQNLSSIATRLPRFRAGISARPLVPPVQLDLITLYDGWVAIGGDLDGLILDKDGRVVRETAMFTRWAPQQTIDLPLNEAGVDDVFVGFDGGWANWYHWICFALGRSAIAAGVLDTATRIVLPAYASRRHVAFGEAAWAQSLEAFDLARRAHFLPRGLHRARSIRLFLTTPDEPTNLTYLDVFQDAFKRVRRGLRLRPDLPRRLLLSRGRSGSLRISATETALVERVTARHGFVPLPSLTLDKPYLPPPAHNRCALVRRRLASSNCVGEPILSDTVRMRIAFRVPYSNPAQRSRHAPDRQRGRAHPLRMRPGSTAESATGPGLRSSG